MRYLASPTPRLLSPLPLATQKPRRPARCFASGNKAPSSINVKNAQSSSNVLPEAQQFTRRASAAVVAGLAAAALLLTPPSAIADTFSSSEPLYDGARIVPAEKRAPLAAKLAKLESETGWRVRVYTNYGAETKPTREQIRDTWGLGPRTVILQFDPSSPNIVNPLYLGDDALMALRRPFWIELQSRFGNMFYVRQEGEGASVLNSVDAVALCLSKPGGCAVVPGLTSDQYGFTLAVAVAAGLVAGAVSRLEPQGFIQRQWLWPLIFSPLWGSLFFNLSLGPVISRTDDVMPIAGNAAAFLAVAALIKFGPELVNGTGGNGRESS